MGFDLEQLSQTLYAAETYKKNYYEKLSQKSYVENRMGYLSSFRIAIVSSSLTIASKVAEIFESIVKGVIDVLGCPFSKQCKFGRGLVQIFINVPEKTIRLPFSILSAIWGLFEKTVMIPKNPADYFDDKVKEHDDNLNKKYAFTYEDFLRRSGFKK